MREYTEDEQRVRRCFYLHLWDEPGVLAYVRERAEVYKDKDSLVHGLLVLLDRAEKVVEVLGSG